MSTPAIIGLVALLAAGSAAQAQSPGDQPPSPPSTVGPTLAPATGPSPPSKPSKDAGPAPPAAGNGAAPDASKPADAAKPADANTDKAEKPKPQKEPGWYTGGIYSFNLLNIEYYDLNTRDLHFSGQRRDIDSDWAGLADLLTKSKAMGFVEIDRKFVNLRNLSAIHDLGGSRGATLTFRDGATLKISASELRRLIEVTK